MSAFTVTSAAPVAISQSRAVRQQGTSVPRRCNSLAGSAVRRPSIRSSVRRHQGSSLQVVSALPVTDIAVSPAFPSLVSLAFRVASAGFLLYSSLQWASARNSRKQVERNMKDQEQRRSEQKKKLDRLRGATDKDQQE